MNKNEFLNELSHQLMNISADEREAALKYYDDYFADAGSENEQAIINELGSPQMLANNIKNDLSEAKDTDWNRNTPIDPNAPKQDDYHQNQFEQNGAAHQNPFPNQYTKNDNVHHGPQNKNPWIIVLLVLGFPLWLPLLLVGFSLFLVFFIVIAIVPAIIFGAFLIAGVSMLVVGAITSIGGFVSLITLHASGIYIIGSGLTLFGLGILLTVPMLYICKTIVPKLFKGSSKFITNVISKRKRRTYGYE